MEDTAQLVERARNGDAEAFGTLYGLIWRDLYKFALYTLRDPQEAEDAVQESALMAFRSVGALRDPAAFRAWIFRILARRCKKSLKRAAGERGNLTFDELEEKGIFLRAMDMDAPERAALWETMGILDGRERLVVLLCVLGGYSSEEIGSMTGCPAGTVRSRLHRGLERLRAALGVGGDAPQTGGTARAAGGRV